MEEFVDLILYDPVVSRLVIVFFGIAVIWGIIKLLKRNFASRIDNTQARYRTRKAISFVGYLVTIILITVVFSDKLGGVGVALGVAGAGIAFALQEVITSIAGWMAISFGGFYKSGDRVQLGGITGDVIDIGVLRTTIMETGEWVNGDLYNGRIVLVANSFVFKEPVFNYSGDFSFLWDEIQVPVQYGSNYSLTRQILFNAAKEVVTEFMTEAGEEWSKMLRKYMLEAAKTEPQVSMVMTNDGVTFTLRYAVNYKMRRSTKDKLYEYILTAIETSNGAIKAPAPTLQIVDTPELKVKMRQEFP